MIRIMLKQFEIAQAVVFAVPLFAMVDYLLSSQVAPEEALHHQSMFAHVPVHVRMRVIGYKNKNIARLVNGSTAFPTRV